MFFCLGTVQKLLVTRTWYKCSAAKKKIAGIVGYVKIFFFAADGHLDNKTPIHSSVYYSIVANGVRVSFLNIPIHHYDILLPERTQRKREQYIGQIRDQLKKEKQDDAYIAALHIVNDKRICPSL